MTIKTITDPYSSDSRVALAEVVRVYNSDRKGNPKVSIYLIAYGTADHRLSSSETVGEVGAIRNSLKLVRQTLLEMGVSAGKVVIVGIVNPNKARAGQIDVVVTPVPLPVVVWTQDGLQTGAGQSGPDMNGSLNVEPDDQDPVTTEVEVEFSSRKFKATLTFQHTATGFKEVSGKLKLLNIDILQSSNLGPLKKIKLSVKSGLVYDHEKEKIKAKVVAELSVELKIPGLGPATIKSMMTVDHQGKVVPGVGLEIPLPGPFQ